MSIRVLVFDDHPVVHYGLNELLTKSGYQIVGHAYDGGQAISRVRRLRPDVILLDVQMPGVDGLHVLEEIKASDYTGSVIIFSEHDNPTYIARAVALGADSYVLKSDAPEILVRAIEQAVAGEEADPNCLYRRVQQIMQTRRGDVQIDHGLTNRELQALRHVALGLSNREIGRSLGISVETVKEHVQNILRKLDAKDRTEAAVWAVRNELTKY